MHGKGVVPLRLQHIHLTLTLVDSITNALMRSLHHVDTPNVAQFIVKCAVSAAPQLTSTKLIDLTVSCDQGYPLVLNANTCGVRTCERQNKNSSRKANSKQMNSTILIYIDNTQIRAAY